CLWWSEWEMVKRTQLLGFVRGLAADSPEAAEMLQEMNRRAAPYPFLFVGAACGLLGAALSYFRQGVVGGLMMLFGAVCPVVFAPATIVVSGFLALGGVLSFFILSHQAALEAAERQHNSGELPTGDVAKWAAFAFVALLVLVGAWLVGSLLVRASANFPQMANVAQQRQKPQPEEGEREKPGVPMVPFDTIKEEVEKAGAGVKLVKLDLAPIGLDMTMQAPKGTEAKMEGGRSYIVKDERFYME